MENGERRRKGDGQIALLLCRRSFQSNGSPASNPLPSSSTTFDESSVLFLRFKLIDLPNRSTNNSSNSSVSDISHGRYSDRNGKWREGKKR